MPVNSEQFYADPEPQYVEGEVAEKQYSSSFEEWVIKVLGQGKRNEGYCITCHWYDERPDGLLDQYCIDNPPQARDDGFPTRYWDGPGSP